MVPKYGFEMVGPFRIYLRAKGKRREKLVATLNSKDALSRFILATPDYEKMFRVEDMGARFITLRRDRQLYNSDVVRQQHRLRLPKPETKDPDWE
jgi:hypothetical protein